MLCLLLLFTLLLCLASLPRVLRPSSEPAIAHAPAAPARESSAAVIIVLPAPGKVEKAREGCCCAIRRAASDCRADILAIVPWHS